MQFCRALLRRQKPDNDHTSSSSWHQHHQLMDSVVDHAALQVFAPWPGLRGSHQCWRQWPTPEPAPLSQLWRLQPARPQPPPNPLLRSSGLDLAGIKMASLFCPNARAMLMFSVSFQIYRLAGNKNSKSLCPHTWRLPSKIKPRTGDFCGSTRSRGKDIRFTLARADMQNQGRIQHHKPWFIAANFQEGKSITRQKSSQVSPNTRWLAQCKGGGGKNKMYVLI